MKQPGQIVLFRFPATNFDPGKLRPALLLGKLPGAYDDWLICMISTQIRQYVDDFDELVRDHDDDFVKSGLKATSVIRIGRLAVVEGDIFLGAIGEINQERLKNIKTRLSNWLIRVISIVFRPSVVFPVQSNRTAFLLLSQEASHERSFSFIPSHPVALVDSMPSNRPVRCYLWLNADLTPASLAPETFTVLATYLDESHHIRKLLQCRECGQLYFYAFTEEIDWQGGNDPQQRLYPGRFRGRGAAVGLAQPARPGVASRPASRSIGLRMPNPRRCAGSGADLLRLSLSLASAARSRKSMGLPGYFPGSPNSAPVGLNNDPMISGPGVIVLHPGTLASVAVTAVVIPTVVIPGIIVPIHVGIGVVVGVGVSIRIGIGIRVGVSAGVPGTPMGLPSGPTTYHTSLTP